jgi:signal transduction histidine kinase
MPQMDGIGTKRAPWPALVVRRWPERRATVLGATAGLLVVALVAASTQALPAPALALLGTLPVLLAALELGIAGGIAGAAIAFAPVAVRGDAGAGLAGAAGALAAVALMAGRFSDRMRQAQARNERLLRSGLLLGRIPTGRTLADRVAQSAMRVVEADGATVAFDGERPVAVGHEHGVHTVLPLAAGRGRLGDVRVSTAAALDSEQHAALQLVALQGALARDNELLVRRERERLAVEAELRGARERLVEQHSELDYLLTTQETERSNIAFRLHEELAQVLASVLMGLKMMSDRAHQPGVVQVEELGRQIVGVLEDLRRLATELRPNALDHLGLGAALEFAASERGDGVAIDARDLPADLPKRTEIAAYRIVDEAIAAARGAHADRAAHASVTGGGDELRIELDLPADVSLAGISARVRLAGGSFEAAPLSDATRVCVSLPLAQTPPAFAR